jgi:hypothetical protein
MGVSPEGLTCHDVRRFPIMMVPAGTRKRDMDYGLAGRSKEQIKFRF